MNKLYPSLIFPDTDIFSYKQFPSLLFGSPLYFLELVEPDPNGPRGDRHVFIDSGLYRAHNPTPLDDDKSRFRRLIKDIRERKDDYAAQLAALTVAAMSAKREKSAGEERYQIISSLLGRPTPPSLHEQEVQLDLWQARLVLAIAEILAQEEEELAQDLQLLDTQEMEMFLSLQGETGPGETDPFNELERISAQLNRARPGEMKMRFRSWLTLMRSAPLPDASLWLASSSDAGDELINEYEKQHEPPPLPILELELPDHIEAGPVHVVSQVKAFLDDSEALRKAICLDLNSIVNVRSLSADSADNLLPSSGDYIGQWGELINDHFPAGSHGRSSLLFYLLPDCPIAALLALEQAAGSSQPAHGLFAVHKR